LGYFGGQNRVFLGERGIYLGGGEKGQKRVIFWVSGGQKWSKMVKKWSKMGQKWSKIGFFWKK
jgi:6-phosphogluconolactonase/glucosamine-6-phosphate isomerase/deaminase